MDNFDYSVIGQRIKTLRKRKGLNQTQLANLLGKSLRTVQKYETGEIEVSIDVVNEMAKHLDTTPTFILGYETNTAPIRSLADIMSFLFELNKVSSIKFDVDVKKPPRSNEWTCSIRFNGKEMDADTMRICACSWNNGKKCVMICEATVVLPMLYIGGRSRPLRTMRVLRWNVWNPKHLTRTSVWLVAEHSSNRSMALGSKLRSDIEQKRRTQCQYGAPGTSASGY